MEDFAKPLRVFSPDGAIDKKLHCELLRVLQPARAMPDVTVVLPLQRRGIHGALPRQE